MTWQEQFAEAVTEWRAALDAFNHAEPDYVDYHILRLYTAEQKLALILKQAKAAWRDLAGLPRAPRLTRTATPPALPSGPDPSA